MDEADINYELSLEANIRSSNLNHMKMLLMTDHIFRIGAAGSLEGDAIYLQCLKDMTCENYRIDAIRWAIRKHYPIAGYVLTDAHLSALAGAFLTEEGAFYALKMVLKCGQIRRQLSTGFEAMIVRRHFDSMDIISRWMLFYHKYTESMNTPSAALYRNSRVMKRRNAKKKNCCYMCL